MGLINSFKFDEFKKALNSIDCIKIVGLLKGWGDKYFKDRSGDYLDEVRRFLARIVFELGNKIDKGG